MGFSARQLRALKRNPDHHHVRTREVRGRELTYLEGWYAISQANRIFGFDGWSRETIDSRCVLARENKGSFTAVYTAKVRLTILAEGTTIVREGHGTGEGRGASPGEVHDTALKAAETDATKRALATFGRPFGLELYRSHRAASLRTGQVSTHQQAAQPLLDAAESSPRANLHPDDTTPIPRPSRYYGQRTDEINRQFAREGRDAQRHLENGAAVGNRPQTITPSPALAPTNSDKIDKSQLMLGEPKRLRDKAHLKYVASQACLVCGRSPTDAHHVRFAQPRAIGLKVSDEFTVPLCRTHHRQLHNVGDERIWWLERKINPLEIAGTLWEQTHSRQTAASGEDVDGDQLAAAQTNSLEPKGVEEGEPKVGLESSTTTGQTKPI
jgi:hypothetical protein